MLIFGTKTITCSVSDIQIYLGILYFYMLNLVPLTGRDFTPATLEIRVGREEKKARACSGRQVVLLQEGTEHR